MICVVALSRDEQNPEVWLPKFDAVCRGQSVADMARDGMCCGMPKEAANAIVAGLTSDASMFRIKNAAVSAGAKVAESFLQGIPDMFQRFTKPKG